MADGHIDPGRSSLEVMFRRKGERVASAAILASLLGAAIELLLVAYLWVTGPSFAVGAAAVALPLLLLAVAVALRLMGRTVPPSAENRRGSGVLVMPVLFVATAGLGGAAMQLRFEDNFLRFGLPLGLLVAGLAWWHDRWRLDMPRAGKIGAFLLFGCLCFFGMAALAHLDADLDTAPGRTFATRVLDKRIDKSSGRRASYEHYYLTLAPWDNRVDPSEEGVSGPMYDRTPVGALLCLRQHPGALGVAWYEIFPCDRQGEWS